MSETKELVEQTKQDKNLIITTSNIIQAAKAYQEAASLPPEAMTSIISAVQAAYGLEQLIKRQRRLPPEKRKALVSVSPGRVITDTKLKEIDEFVVTNRIPYNCLYIAKDGNIAVKASGWRLRAQADLRCFKGFEEKPIEMQVLDDGNILFRKEVVAVFWNGSRFPATGFADINEVQSRRTMTEAPPSFVAMIAETRAKTRALRDAIGLPFEIAEDVIEAAEAEYQPPAPAPSGEITSIAELLARAQKEFGLRRKDILNILGVNSLGEITDLQASWEKISAINRQTGAGETEEDAA